MKVKKKYKIDIPKGNRSRFDNVMRV